jgi:hypothetical protein
MEFKVGDKVILKRQKSASGIICGVNVNTKGIVLRVLSDSIYEVQFEYYSKTSIVQLVKFDQIFINKYRNL